MAKKKSGTGAEKPQKASEPKQQKPKKEKKPNEGKTHYERIINQEIVNAILADTPDINRTASLYARTDLYKCMCDFMQELLPEHGFPEDCFWMDVRLVFCIIASVIALYTIVYLKFPGDYNSILVAVVLFAMVAMAVTWVDSTKVGNDNFFVTKDENGNRIYMAIAIDDSSSKVTLAVRGGAKGGELKGEHCVSRYFDEDGYVVLENLFEDIAELTVKHCGGLNIIWQRRGDYEPEGGKGGKGESKKKK